ncbi:hypothetical protein NDU88_001184 [Pleurodeles waltl]|uniref:Uncharacterized protein n=1 Tax=Pleurodeles waltl TaxID=8319 RepID=A0AAV7R6F3_PLEWA|nr:hypothetical protein NDU88_001184 [Pleurodeles waltl]
MTSLARARECKANAKEKSLQRTVLPFFSQEGYFARYFPLISVIVFRKVEAVEANSATSTSKKRSLRYLYCERSAVAELPHA